MIFILNRQEKVVDVLKNDGQGSSPFFDDVLTQDLSTGSDVFTFTTISKHNVANNLIIGNYVAFKKHNSYKLFQIMQTEERHEEVIYVDVYCECVGLELINSIFRKTTMVSATLRTFMDAVLADTTWNVGHLDITSTESLDLTIDDSSVYSVLQTYAKEYEVELDFRVEINHGRISNKFVDALAMRGSITGKRFTYQRDIEGISRKTDSTSLYTALIGKGKNDISFRNVTVSGINKPAGQDFVADQTSFERYNANGYHIMGIFEFDTTSPEELLRQTYKQLQKVKQPKIEYDVSVSLLGELIGEKWNTVSIGDTITVYDGEFNPPIKVMARVSKLETSFTNPQNDKCTLSNFVEVTSNITNDIKKISSKLEGYVDSRFPIVSQDISDNAVTQTKIQDASIIGIKIATASINNAHIEDAAINDAKIANAAITSAKIANAAINSAHINTAQITNGHIANAAIDSAKIANASIGTVHIQDAVVTNEKIANATITAAKIGNAQITTAHIQDAVITNEKVANAAITSAKIANANINSAHIADAAITTAHIGTAAITNAKIANGSITNAHIQNAEITNEKIANSTITNAKIANATITGANIASATIGTAHIQDASITNGKISNLAVGTAHIQDASISTAKIGDGQITTAKIANASINNAHIIDATIDNAKIANGTITSAKIANAAITTALIDTGAVQTAQIADGSITDAKIVGLTANKITAGTIDAAEIDVINLHAANITVGTINGQQIAQGTIQSGNIATGAITTANIAQGAITAEQLASGVVTGDKLALGTISANHLNLSKHTLY